MRVLAFLVMVSLALPVNAEAPANQLTESEQRSGWQLLFDGKSTDGWRGYKKDAISDGWKVIDGALVRSQNGAGDIVTEKKYGSFELSIEYKISQAGNSGLMFHVVEGAGPPWFSGPEIQIQDNVDGHDPQKSGWLYQLYKPGRANRAGDKSIIDSTRPAGQWNQLYLRINKNDCEVCMNGVHYFHFSIGSQEWDQRVAASKFAKYSGFGKAADGYLCLQDHGDEVAFRNIKLRQITDDNLVPDPIDGSLEMSSVLAFPNLTWDQWDAVDDAGQVRPLRLIGLTYPKDGSNRLFAASQFGEIWAFENRSDTTQSRLLLDLRGKVFDWKKPNGNEQGLLGLAVHPDFKNSGHFFVYYTHPTDSKSVISRFTISKEDSNRADPESEQILMEIDQPYANHNGGSMEFGPDGYLYIGVGDGGYRNDPHDNGQNLSTILGSILRIDVDHSSNGKNYGIPADNPFVDVKDSRPEIYAYGIRNPWQIAFDKSTGRLWSGDVGQELWEEVIVVKKGGNYGWSRREGTHPFGNRGADEGNAELLEPIWEYDHRIGKSVTGGRVYRSNRLPKLAGKYVYADYVTGSVWALTYDPKTERATRNERIVPDNLAVLAFGEDDSGEIYVLTTSARGECIYRFESEPAKSDVATQ